MDHGLTRWLQAVQQMEPIVSTAVARELRDVPDAVRARYEKHVALYVPLARVATTDDGPSVPALERRLIKLVKDQLAPRGYVAAHYGHGKTSTGLFLWKRCEEARIVAVPPFKLTDLPDIVTATHGWMRHILGRERPHLVGRADEIVQLTATADLESLARRYDISAATAQRMFSEGRLSLELDGLQYVRFLTAMTELVKEAGFAGLVILADEIQQYLGEAKAHGWDEQLRRWFDLTEALRSRKGDLPCGIVYLIRSDELAAVNGDRSDLVQRLQESRVHLDLSEVYGDDFPSAFSRNVAGEEGYREVVSRIIDDHTLRALGQIATRADLAAGPRTVVDVLRIAAQRFEAGGGPAMTPPQLIEIFERGAVTFDGLSKIQQVLREALAHPIVVGNGALADAVRLAAAFPTTGATRSMARQYHLDDGLAELERLAAGDLVTVRGGGFDQRGQPLPEGVLLIGLAAQKTVASWLKEHVRRFRTQYFLASERVRQHAAAGFEALLFRSLFPTPQWRTDREFEETSLTQNRAFLLRGSFTALQARYPDRLVYVRVLLGNKTIRDAVPAEADLVITFLLEAAEEMHDAEATRPGAIDWISEREARIHVNLLHRTPGTFYHNLNPGFEDLVSPHDVTPLLLLSLHASLRRAEEANRIPNVERATVVSVFMPELLKAALYELANPDLGRELNANQSRIIEEVLRRLCESAFPDYHTLMTAMTWQQGLREYQQGLSRDDPLERRGETSLVGTKEQIARLFGKTSATFDAYRQNFGYFFQVDQEWRGRDSTGKVRLTLHPLERRICEDLERLGRKIPFRNPATRHIEEVPSLDYAQVCRSAQALGYRTREVEVALELLEARQLVQWRKDEQVVLRVEPPVPDRGELLQLCREYKARLDHLAGALDQPEAIQVQVNGIAGWIRRLEGTEQVGGVELVNGEKTLATFQRQLGDILRSIWDRLMAEAEQLTTVTDGLDRPIAPIDRGVATMELFGRQLDQARGELAGQQSDLVSRADQLRREVARVGQRLRGGAASDEGVAEVGPALRRLQAEVSRIQSARDRLRGQVNALLETDRLLRDAHGLRQRALRDTALASQVNPIDDWSANIEASITRGRVAALDGVPAWRAALEAIERIVTQREREAEERFMSVQERLLAVVRRDLKGEGQLEWRPVVFNPANPDASVQELGDRFAGATEGIARRLGATMRDVQERLLAIERAPDVQSAAADLRAAIVEGIDRARENSRQATEGLNGWLDLAVRVRTEPDPIPIANRIATSAPAIYAAVAEAAVLHQQLQKTVQERVALSDEEATAYAVLRQRSQASVSGQRLEWDTVRTALGDPAEAGTLLARLADKHRVRILVEIIET